VRKRIEHFRDKVVDRMGVELGGGDYRLAICRFVLTHHFVTTRDLACLDEPDPG
jgi:ABC-type transport system involved in cytochrome bd biosynthesis fused ATPase/permease subunit